LYTAACVSYSYEHNYRKLLLKCISLLNASHLLGILWYVVSFYISAQRESTSADQVR